MMKKHIKILFSLLLLLALGGCSDDFHWDGVKVEEDEYLIAFTNSGMQMEVLNATRADDATRDKVDNLTLVIFKDGKLWESPLYFTPGDDNCTAPSGDTPGSIRMKKREVTEGDWLLVANAKSEISSFVDNHRGDVSKADFLSGIKYGKSSNDGAVYGPDQLNGESAHVMTVIRNITDVVENQTAAEVFELKRIYSRISVEISGDLMFVMTSARLSRTVESGSLAAEKSSTVGTAAVSATEGWIAPADGLTWTSPAFKYAKKGEKIMTATYPYQVSKTAANNGKIMMMVRGYFNQGSKDEPKYESPCYYAIPLPDCEANRWWNIKINGCETEGRETPAEAEANPGGLSVEFEDAEPGIHNIISDGENVLAVVDTVKFDASGAGLTQNLIIKARKAGSSAPAFTIEPKDRAAATWFTGMENYASWPAQNITGTVESDNGLFTSKVTGTLKANANEGSDRALVYTVKLNGTKLERDFVVYQKANDNLDYSSVVSIRLQIKKGSTVLHTINDYLKFIKPDASTTEKCYGLQPDENGGRVRNLGLHMPMPNGGVTYVYTLTAKNGATISETTYTFNDTDVPSGVGGTSKYSYATKSDYIEIKKGEVIYTLDLYHTGFFHNLHGEWFYYEVMQQGERDLYWLDRNLGAMSAGMGVRTSTGVLTSTAWPIVGENAMGEMYNLSEARAACPDGWGVPSYAQMRSMTVSSGFSQNRLATEPAHVTYIAPTYSFQALEDGQVKRINSYFPQNRILVDGGFSKDASSGYYLTKTGAGTSGWYQTMQFVGMNVTSQNIDYSNSQASVRCCAGSYDPQTESETYTCSVKGYTHVFLYYLNSDGSKTYLTTWPGEQVAVYTDINRYHPFEIEPTMSYNTDRLYVIFNTVNTSGVRTDSNMSEEDVKNRQGTKFVNGGWYNKDATPKLADVKAGNWVDGDTPGPDPVDEYKYIIKGTIWQDDAWRYNTYYLKEESGKWTYRSVTIKEGNFIVGKFKKSTTVNNNETNDNNRVACIGAANSNEKDFNVTAGNTKTISIMETESNNFSIKAGTYDIVIDPSAMTITVTNLEQGGNFTDDCKIYGDFGSVENGFTNWNTSGAEKTTTTDNNKYVYKVTAASTGEIFFRFVYKGTIYGPDSTSDDVEISTNGPNSNSPIAKANSESKAFKANLTAGKTYEIEFWREYNGQTRVAISTK